MARFELYEPLPSSVVTESRAQRVYLSAYMKKGPTEDCSAEFKTAAEKAMELDAVLVVPKECTLASEVAIVNNANRRLRIEGAGAQYSTIVDKCTAGPCLRYERTDKAASGFSFRGFTFKLECQKPEKHMVELVNLGTANFVVDEVWWTGDASVHFWKCRSGLCMEDLWEGSFNNCRWESLIGHQLWYDCPTENGGNVAFNDCQSFACTGGHMVRGGATTNNVQFKNSKWVTSSGKEFYEKLTAGIPAKGATEVTIAAGASAYFSGGYTVLLVSAAGMDIMHVLSEGGYNNGTGVLKFQEATTKEHAAHSDLRVICCSAWSVITDFIVPSLEFINCHTEQAPMFLKDAPNVRVSSHQTSTTQTSSTGEAHIFYLAGKYTTGAIFTALRMYHAGGKEAAAVCPLAIEPTGEAGLPNFEINKVSAYGATPSMTNTEWRPFWSPDATYQSTTAYPANIKVTLTGGGVERDSTVSGYRGVSVITATNAAWPIPPGVKWLEITAVGGGGGGGGGGSSSSIAGQVGGSGGTAGVDQTQLVEVGANTTLNISIGAGGEGGEGGAASGKAGEAGKAGGTTSVTATGISIKGASGGNGNGSALNSSTAVKAISFGNAATALTGASTPGTGGESAGNAPACPANGSGGGGGGGTTTATNGGSGGKAGTVALGGEHGTAGGSGTTAGGEGESAGANTGAGGGGGGGGAWNGGTGPGAGGKGGKGGSGYVIVRAVG